MDITSTMERTLQTGTLKTSAQVSETASNWPDEFRRPVDAALHLGTPKPSLHPVETLPISGPMFID